ncbi:Uncharacterized protein PHSC3_001833 [Chlamydiales bacterium STE3]|nr:Uncharacterized protein PHSC3_001833 [Chlamydiales bacterium STE3]
MTYHISVRKACSSYTGLDTFTDRTFTLQDKDEYERVLKLCKNKKNMAGLFKASIIPIRTDSSSIGTDLFLPTLIHGVIKTKNASKVCFILLALLWDSVTLPFRLITLLPRVCYNAFAKSTDHPLIPYLKEKGLDSLNRKGEVKIRVYEETIKNSRYEKSGFRYKLFLTNHEVPFVGDFCQFGSFSSRPTNSN